MGSFEYVKPRVQGIRPDYNKPMKAIRPVRPGLQDLMAEPLNTIVNGTLNKHLHQDFCDSHFKAKLDDRMVDMYLHPQRWHDRPERWVTHKPEAAPSPEPEETMPLTLPAVSSSPSKAPSSTGGEMTRLSDASSRRSSVCENCRTQLCQQRVSDMSVPISQLPGQNLSKPQGKLSGLERAKSAPLITRVRDKARSDYGRPSPGMFYNFAKMHKSPNLQLAPTKHHSVGGHPRQK